MTSYVNLFLKTEITAIPRLLDKYIGNYYNNALCNGAAWMFLSWYIMHVVFDGVLDALLKKMRYKEYVRIRIECIVWYLGFYSTACIYCVATLLQNNIRFIETKAPFDSLVSPAHSILGFIVLATFYLHSAFWERLKHCNVMLALSYLSLFFLLIISYFLRFIQGTYRLTVLVCLTQITLELARCVTVLCNNVEYKAKIITGVMFALCLFSFIINYLLILPFLLGYPLLNEMSPGVMMLVLFMSIWLTVEICNSVLVKAALHHLNKKHKQNCNEDLLECSLFPPRDDATYNFLNLRKEIWEREEKCLALRKPKNRSVVMQTLKCMVAIKRKLNEKRRSSYENKEGSKLECDQEDCSINNENYENNVKSRNTDAGDDPPVEQSDAIVYSHHINKCKND